jgi:hypothetical protein
MGMRKLLQLGKFISKGNDPEKVKTDAPGSQNTSSSKSPLAQFDKAKFPQQQTSSLPPKTPVQPAKKKAPPPPLEQATQSKPIIPHPGRRPK